MKTTPSSRPEGRPGSAARPPTTVGGFATDEVVSALQKEIRRGHEENAVLLAHELVATSAELEEFLWLRLLVISVEDVGFGDPTAAVLVEALHRIRETLCAAEGPRARDRELFAVHAIRYLCRSPKDRSSDEMALWVRMASEVGTGPAPGGGAAGGAAEHRARPTIPDYALDMHTAAGKEMGRGLRHFMEEGARVSPEAPGRDTTYRERIMALLDEKEATR